MQITDPRFNNHLPIELSIFRYADNNNICLDSSVLDEDGFTEKWARYTVNMGEKLPDDRVALKVWSENRGIEQVLAQAGVIEGEPVQYLSNGHIVAPVYKLSPAFMLEYGLQA